MSIQVGPPSGRYVEFRHDFYDRALSRVGKEAAYLFVVIVMARAWHGGFPVSHPIVVEIAARWDIKDLQSALDDLLDNRILDETDDGYVCSKRFDSPVWRTSRVATKNNQSERNTRAMKDWSVAVRARSGGQCERCGSTDKLHAHHVKSYADHPDLRFSLDNGIALCIDCHGEEHGRSLR